MKPMAAAVSRISAVMLMITGLVGFASGLAYDRSVAFVIGWGFVVVIGALIGMPSVRHLHQQRVALGGTASRWRGWRGFVRGFRRHRMRGLVFIERAGPFGSLVNVAELAEAIPQSMRARSAAAAQTQIIVSCGVTEVTRYSDHVSVGYRPVCAVVIKTTDIHGTEEIRKRIFVGTDPPSHVTKRPGHRVAAYGDLPEETMVKWLRLYPKEGVGQA